MKEGDWFVNQSGDTLVVVNSNKLRNSLEYIYKYDYAQKDIELLNSQLTSLKSLVDIKSKIISNLSSISSEKSLIIGFKEDIIHKKDDIILKLKKDQRFKLFIGTGVRGFNSNIRILPTIGAQLNSKYYISIFTEPIISKEYSYDFGISIMYQIL